MTTLAPYSDKLVREWYEKGDEVAREELIKRGLIACRHMSKEAERSRKAFKQRPEHWGRW